ncbi:AAWKG family protein [Streptomyces sp. NBC_01478]|uniref:AAWKG family protein n=1 Tax=Streptomyces sp. NBC_01478 TaxID=2903882 RepID=UPI002E315D39|nr:AAWKG family protein [Streptomyces sp. NBC_01478]
MADSTPSSGSPTYDPDDYFAQAVTDFTGYTIPTRSSLFTKLSSSNDDSFGNLKLFRMDIQGMDIRSVTAADYSAIGGWHVNSGEDYDLAFYDAGGDGAHNSVDMKKARIVMIGVTVDEHGRATLWSGGDIVGGGAFEGSYSHVQWDSGPMAQYISGSKLVLDHILASPYSTQGFSYSGLSVVDANAVDMLSFENTGQSFDRVVQFFKDHSDVVNQWMTSLGEDQAAWKGKAASLFWHLLDELKTNYDGYVSQLGGRDYTATNSTLGGYVPKSKLSDALAAAQQALKQAITDLQTAWNNWASDGQHDPHYHVKKILDEISQWVINNNINHVMEETTAAGESVVTTYSTTDGFKQVHPDYGDLTQKTTWQKVADGAVKSWSDHADSKLKQPSIDALSNVKNAWADVEDAFAQEVKNKNNETLSEVLQKEENEIAEDEAKENNDKLNENLNNLGDNLNNLNDNVNDNLNNLGDNLNNLNDGLNDNLNNLGDNLNNFGTNLNDNLNDNLNNIGDGLNSSLNNLNDDLGNSLNNVGSGLDDLNSNSLLNNDGSGGNDLSNLANSLLTPSLLNGNDPTKNGSTTLNSPTGGTTQLNGDGTLTTTFPDGSTQTIDPSTGLVTTTNPDGTTSVSQLNPGTTITNPDGSTTTLNDDGTLTTKFPDGTSQTIDPTTGQVSTLNPDGTTSLSQLNPTDGSFTTPDGSTAQLNADGSVTTHFPDGSTETLNPDTGQISVTDPSGHVTTTHLNPGDTFTNPDGSTTTLNNDGTLTTKFPDGSVQTLNPDTGQLTTTDPSGHTTTTDIDGSGLPSSSIDTSNLNGSTIDTSGLNNGTSLDTSGLNTTGLNSGGLSSGGLNTSGGGLDSGLDGGYDDYDSTPYTGGPLRSDALDTSSLAAASTDAQSASGGTPLNPMGMGGMGGMGGGMGGGGGGGQGGATERTRAVLTDPSNTSTRRGRNTRAASVDEDEDIVLTRPTTSSAPYPVGGPGNNAAGQNGRSTESGDRARDAWLTEDEDVWGTDEGGSPAVIGR